VNDQHETIGGQRRLWRSLAWLLALCGAMIAAPAMAACSAPTTLTDPLGTYSSPTIKAGATGYLSVPGGFTCTSASVLTLLGANYLRVTVDSAAVLEIPSLTLAGTPAKPIATVPYSLAVAASGTPALTPGNTVYLINGTALNLLGLLGDNAMNVPLFIKPQSAAQVPPGNYQGTVKVKWEWRFCSVIEAAGICVGTLESGTATTTITFTLTVVASRPATVTIASVITWDPVSGTNSPKMIPGAKRRVTMTVANPDLVPLDLNKLNVTLPTPAGTVIALDGDGTGQGQVIQFTPNASTLLFNYTSPSDLGDDVDFSTNGGASYIAVPTPGDAASQASVNSVLFHPRGAMAAGSSFSVSLPYSVR
jgi:hypothetical protein